MQSTLSTVHHAVYALTALNSSLRITSVCSNSAERWSLNAAASGDLPVPLKPPTMMTVFGPTCSA